MKKVIPTLTFAAAMQAGAMLQPFVISVDVNKSPSRGGREFCEQLHTFSEEGKPIATERTGTAALPDSFFYLGSSDSILSHSPVSQESSQISPQETLRKESTVGCKTSCEMAVLLSSQDWELCYTKHSPLVRWKKENAMANAYHTRIPRAPQSQVLRDQNIESDDPTRGPFAIVLWKPAR